MSRIDHNRLRHRGKPTETPKAKPQSIAGWSHIKREPVRILTAEERAEWLRGLGL